MLHGSLTIQRLLAAMTKMNASDLHLKVGVPPVFRVGGVLRTIDAPPLTGEEADHFVDPLMTPALRQKLDEQGAVDFATHLDTAASGNADRFRVDIFKSGGHIHAAIRRVKAEIPDYAKLRLPPIYSQIVEKTMEGLVLVVGVTGSGKSSTLAAMIEHINETRAENIITIEDPVEYKFTPRKSIISQREIGIDVPNYGYALKYVVRQDPDVIFIGEMRDHDTVLAAIQAAETGHLVFGSLHTADTMQAISRILEFFEPKDHAFVRGALANTLRDLRPAAPADGPRVRAGGERLTDGPRDRGAPRHGHREGSDPRRRRDGPPGDHPDEPSRRDARLHALARGPREEGVGDEADRDGLCSQPRSPGRDDQGS